MPGAERVRMGAREAEGGGRWSTLSPKNSPFMKTWFFFICPPRITSCGEDCKGLLAQTRCVGRQEVSDVIVLNRRKRVQVQLWSPWTTVCTGFV